MSPPTNIYPASPPSTHNQLEQQVIKIISKRKKGALSGIVIVWIVVAYLMFFGKTSELKILAISSLVILSILGFVYLVNARNYPNPKASYRLFNSIVYNFFSKLTIVLSILRVGSDTAEILNPMHGFKDPTALTRPELLLDGIVSAGVGVSAYKQLKPAAIVEAYYKQLENDLRVQKPKI